MTDHPFRPARAFPLLRILSLVALGISTFSLMTTHNMRVASEGRESTLRWATQDGHLTIQVSCRTSAECEASREAIRQAIPAVHPIERRGGSQFRLFGTL